MRVIRLLACTALFATAACPRVSGVSERWEARPAIIVDNQDARIVLPARVRAGEEFQVQVTTYGGGCHRQGRTEVVVSQSARSADLYPRDQLNVAAEVCTQQLKMFTHSAAVRIDQPGTAQIRVHGLKLQNEEPVTATRTVEVAAAGS
jgi:hypothetical protein